MAKVKGVVDGDTIKIRGASKQVQLVGIQAPKHRQCGGERSTRSLRTLLQRGDRVRLVPDFTQGNRDSSGRLLRYVELGSVDVGLQQLYRGWARFLAGEKSVLRSERYRNAEYAAKQLELGLWRKCFAASHPE